MIGQPGNDAFNHPTARQNGKADLFGWFPEEANTLRVPDAHRGVRNFALLSFSGPA